MGKIRVKTLGDESLEKEQKKDAKKRKEAKKVAKAPGMKGGERVVAVGPSEKELEHVIASEVKQSQTEKIATSPSAPRDDKKKKKAASKRIRSRRYQSVASMVDKKKQYKLSDALELLPKLKLAKFDETVELHINTIEPGLSGQLNLPHGTGKKTRVAVADDALIAQIEKGKIEFDVLLATPQMMQKLAKVAKVLGPRGLMPNPKNGTITANPEQEAKKYEGGQLRYKTESKLPVMHLTVGKLSFGDKKLGENIKAIFGAIKAEKIKNATLKSTMSPGIKISPEL